MTPPCFPLQGKAVTVFLSFAELCYSEFCWNEILIESCFLITFDYKIQIVSNLVIPRHNSGHPKGKGILQNVSERSIFGPNHVVVHHLFYQDQ